MDQQLLIRGLGGQGILVSTKLIGAAATKAGLFALHYAAYSGEVRGGWIECTLTVSDEPIHLPPTVSRSENCIVMHPAAFDMMAARLRPGGLFMVNSSLVERRDYPLDGRVVEIPATEIGEEIGHEMAGTMAALGAYVELTGFLKLDLVMDALANVIPPHRANLIEIDRKALTAGAEFARAKVSVPA